MQENKIPDSVIETFARTLLPKIQAFYETDEGKKAFEAWKQENDAASTKTEKE